MSQYGNCPDCGGEIPCDCYAGCQDVKAKPSMDSILNKALLNSGKKIEQAAQPDCRTCANYDTAFRACIKRYCLNADQYVASPPRHIWHIH